MKNVVVVSIDRLGAGYLGPYGNTWIETPGFNRLASRSLLLETVIAESPDLASTFRSYWTGRHALDLGRGDRDDSLTARLREFGCRTTLVSDEPEVLQHPLAAAFEERVPVQSPDRTSAARDESETGMAGLFAVACERIASLGGSAHAAPSLLWIHSRGMNAAWDAPYALRSQFADEDDPDPPTFVAPPSRELPESFDPDELLGCQQAYAGQVVLADLCLGALFDALEASPAAAETLLIVTSPRGFPLGEHGAIGACGDRLYGEVLQAPMLLRFPDGSFASRRSQALVQPGDLGVTVASWLGTDGAAERRYGRNLLSQVAGDEHTFRQAVCSTAGPSLSSEPSSPPPEGEHSIRTPAWFMRRSGEGGQLYVKPDDRWEVNEVSDRCADVAEQLTAALEAYVTALQSGGNDPVEPLPAVLLEGLD